MIPQQANERVRAATGGSTSGDGAPNGRNIAGAINTIERLGRLIDANGYADYTELDADRQTEYEAAWSDLQYWIKELSNVVAEDMAGNDDGLEIDIEGRKVSLSNPHRPTTVGTSTAKHPDRPE